jgi:hypothetical protein
MRKTAAQKRLLGTYRPDRDRKRLTFEIANGVEIKAPAFVRKNKIAHGEWKSGLLDFAAAYTYGKSLDESSNIGEEVNPLNPSL